MANKTQRQVSLDFTTGRGFGPMGAELPANFLTFNAQMVCGTIAAVYNQPFDEDDARRSNTWSRAMVQLALYAGGFMATVDKQQFRQLERRVRRYAGLMEAPNFEGMNNLPFARYVLRHAEIRAKAEEVI